MNTVAPLQTSCSVENKEVSNEFIIECQRRIKRYIDKYYQVPSDLKLDMEQRVIELLLTNDIPMYDESKSELWKYISTRISYHSSRAFLEHTSNMSESPEIKRIAKKAKKMMENGMSLDESSEALNVKPKTLQMYLNACSSVYSLDAENEDGDCLYDHISNNQKKSDNEEKFEERLKEVLKGKSKEEQFILKTFIQQKMENKRDWKRSTVNICKKKGLSEKRVTSVLKEFSHAG